MTLRWVMYGCGLVLAGGVMFGCSSEPLGPEPPGPRPDTNALLEEIGKLEAEPGPVILVAVVNPSRKVRKNAFDNLIRVVRKSDNPRLTVVAIYEQKSPDDGPPFNQAIISATRSPAPPARPTLQPDGIKTCSGTEFKKKKCEQRKLSATVEYRDDLEKRRRKMSLSNQSWATGIVEKLRLAQKNDPTEESSEWNIRAALLRVDHILGSIPSEPRCVVLLGGLAVRPPPRGMVLKHFQDATVIVAGWRGTHKLQAEWGDELQKFGAEIIFVPAETTLLQLGDKVLACLAP